MRLFISPNYKGVDLGSHGGIRRVIDAQKEYFSSSLVSDCQSADTIAIHAGSLVPVRPDQKMIAHCHGFYWSKYDWGEIPADAINSAVGQAIHLSDLVTAPTEWVANSIRRNFYRSVSVIPHGVDEQWRPGDVRKSYVLWNKSRIDRVCDPSPVYELAKALPSIEFRMTVGKPSHNVKITGLTPYEDIKPVQEAGVYLATAQETFGIGILEALACGVPVVGWNWGGQAEILPKTWLAQTGDYDTLAKLIVWALESDLSEQCQEIAAKYTWNAAMRLYEELYDTDISHEKRVSVLIRNYKTEEYLPEAIASAKKQITDEDEIIVIDDCSPVGTAREIAESAGVNFEQPEHNLHLAGILNFGMSKAKGRYIVHLDADNLLGDNAIEILTNALDKDRKLDIAYGRVEWFETKLTSDWPPPNFNLSRQLAHKNQIPCTAMYRRRVFDVAGPYRNRCRVAEDADFWCRATTLGFVPRMVTEANTLKYRVRKGTTSQTTPDWAWEKWHTIPNIGDSCEPAVVSVVIPVGSGHELYVQDALDSIYMQTFKNWECIVVNDTGHVLPWMPEWATEIVTIGNLGPANARNIAIQQSQGGLLLFLDADDYLLTPQALDKLVRTWMKNKKHYIYTDYVRSTPGDIHRCTEFACTELKNTMPHIITGLYPKLPGIKFEDTIGEDWDYALQMTAAGYCGVHIPEPLVCYRVTSGNRRANFSETERSYLRNKWEGVEFMCSCKDRAKAIYNFNEPELAGSDLVLVTYIGNEQKRYFIGDASGRTYAFGTLPQLKEKYVLLQDIAGFQRRSNLFNVSNVASDTPVPV